MFRIFQEEKAVTIAMLALMAVSLGIRILLGFLYQGMIKEADNMAATENKLLKQCKLKFANCYQLNNGVANIPIFVDKFLSRLSLGAISFQTLYHLSGQTMLLAVVCAGIGICRSIMEGRMLGEILPFYIVSFAGLYLYFSVSSVVDIQGKRRVLKVNLVDYLENHLSCRIDVTQKDMEMLYGTSYQGARGNARLSREKSRRSVELMPIGGRIGINRDEGKREENISHSEENTAHTGEYAGQRSKALEDEANVYAANIQVSEEELEALLREFLTI